jgi:hypothetical protein
LILHLPLCRVAGLVTAVATVNVSKVDMRQPGREVNRISRISHTRPPVKTVIQLDRDRSRRVRKNTANHVSLSKSVLAETGVLKKILGPVHFFVDAFALLGHYRYNLKNLAGNHTK